MSDEPRHNHIADHKRLWDDVTVQGYALASDQSIGLAETFRQHFHGIYFNERTLRHDEGDKGILDQIDTFS